MNKNVFAAGLLLAACAWPAAAQEASVCADGACAVSRVPRAALAEALRDQPEAQRRTPRPSDAPAPARDPWAARLAGPSATEDYSCLLSVGVGGEFARNGFFATRVLGQTIVLGGKETPRPPK